MDIQVSDIRQRTHQFWYHGFTYNATPGSRAQITTPITPGMVMCHDPEAYTDDYVYQNSGSGTSNLPTGADYGPMLLQPPAGPVGAASGVNVARTIRNITRPATGLLNLVAGVVKNPHPDKVAYGAQAAGAGPQWVELITASEAAWVLCTWSSITPAHGDVLIAADGTFAANIVSQASATAVQLAASIGRVVSVLNTSGSAHGSSGTNVLVLARIGPANLPLH